LDLIEITRFENNQIANDHPKNQIFNCRKDHTENDEELHHSRQRLRISSDILQQATREPADTGDTL
jgi:hypothetical protein